MPGVGEDTNDEVPEMGEEIAKVDKMSKKIEIFDPNGAGEYDETTGEFT